MSGHKGPVEKKFIEPIKRITGQVSLYSYIPHVYIITYYNYFIFQSGR